ncbi:MAG: cyanophycinase [Armatimonadetes bacterium]|nr:cyanophycinase [Armatimonadota bacterium]
MATRRLFLFGGGSADFGALSQPFVHAAGGSDGRIALLFLDRESAERHLERYETFFGRHGAGRLEAIIPGPNGQLSGQTIASLGHCTGFFMAGGDPRAYHRVYGAPAVRDKIRERYRYGVPYAGLSAGAMLVGGTAILAGDRLSDGNPACLRAAHREPQELELGPGLRLLPNVIVEGHFAERGSFPRLIEALRQTAQRRSGGQSDPGLLVALRDTSGLLGLGLDEPAGVGITDETTLSVMGQGRAWLFRAGQPGWMELKLLEPGDTETLT